MAVRALRFAPFRSPGSRMPSRERAVELVGERGERGTHRQNWARLCSPVSRSQGRELAAGIVSCRDECTQRQYKAWYRPR